MIKQTAKIFFLLILLAGISACSRDSCKNVTCPTVTLPGISGAVYEQCYDGQCICPDGYEGTGCQTLSYTKYVGNYTVTENCGSNPSGGPTTYQCSIYSESGQNGNGTNYIAFDPLLNIGQVYAFIENTGSGVNEGTTIYIPAIQLGGTYISNSYGTYYPNSGGTPYIILNLSYTNYSGAFQCQETLYCNSGSCL